MPSRRPDTTKQRLWLGPGGYLCSGRRQYANADPDGDANCNAHSNRNSFSDSYTACDAHAQVWPNGKAPSHSRAPPVKSKADSYSR
jgi:hypothetical protein